MTRSPRNVAAEQARADERDARQRLIDARIARAERARRARRAALSSQATADAIRRYREERERAERQGKPVLRPVDQWRGYAP